MSDIQFKYYYGKESELFTKVVDSNFYEAYTNN